MEIINIVLGDHLTLRQLIIRSSLMCLVMCHWQAARCVCESIKYKRNAITEKQTRVGLLRQRHYFESTHGLLVRWCT